MRTFVTTLSALTLMLGLAAAAGAQDRPAEITPETEFTFEDDFVDGAGTVPEGHPVWLRRGLMRRTLVRPRVHFVPEMLKSVENL